jgi:hypothetical protein
VKTCLGDNCKSNPLIQKPLTHGSHGLLGCGGGDAKQNITLVDLERNHPQIAQFRHRQYITKQLLINDGRSIGIVDTQYSGAALSSVFFI